MRCTVASSTTAALLLGLGNLWILVGGDAQSFIVEAILHSVHLSDPTGMGPHDGYLGMSIVYFTFMLANLVAPVLAYTLPAKWNLALSSLGFLSYFASFLTLNRMLYFAACVVLGAAKAVWHQGYNGYLLHIFTETTLERNQTVCYTAAAPSLAIAGLIYIAVSVMGGTTEDQASHRVYSDLEIRHFYAAFAVCTALGFMLFASLPNLEIKDSLEIDRDIISLKQHLRRIFKTLENPKTILILPFYIYTGIYLTFWMSELADQVFLPAYFSIAFSCGSATMSLVTVAASKRIPQFGLKPSISIIAIALPEWSTVRPTDGATVLIPPSVLSNLIIAFLFGIGDAVNTISRTVMTSLIIPESKAESVAVSRLFHALSGSVLLASATGLSIFMHMALLTTALFAATVSFWVASGVATDGRKWKEDISH